MTTVQNILQEKQAADRRHDVLSAVAAIIALDPHSREDLVCHIQTLNAAQAAGDTEEQAYVHEAIKEVFSLGTDPADMPDLEQWRAEAASGPAGRAASDELDRETDVFFQKYAELKERAGLHTIRAVAAAAGISATTVLAIEKQRTKPQCKTIHALAKAFGVPAAELQ